MTVPPFDILILYALMQWNRVPHKLVITIESYQRRRGSRPILRGSVWI